ncbi:PAS domain S-box protein [Mucilaginibacter sp. AW1-3]
MLSKVDASVKLYMLILITAAGLIGMGLYGINDLKKMDTNTHSLYADRVLPIQQLSALRFEYAVEVAPLAQKVKDHEISFNQAKELIDKAEAAISTNWNNYKLTYLTPEEASLVKQTDDAKKQADKTYKNLRAIFDKEDVVALNAFTQKAPTVSQDPFFLKLTQLMNLQVSVGKQILATNNGIYRTTAKRFVLIILISLAIALSLSFYLTKSIKKLINNILKNNQAIKESEERYSSLFEQASDAIYVLNYKGDFINVNQSMCQMVGYTRDELLTMNIADLVNDELLESNPLVYKSAKPGESVTGERKIIHKNGVAINVEINGKKFEDERVIVIARDITARKALETELRTAELKFRTLADKSMVGIYIVQNAEFIYVNQRFAEIFGYTPDELLGTYPPEKIIHPEYRDIVKENVRLRKEEIVESVHYETMGLKKDETSNWVEFYGSRTFFEDEPTFIGSMIDITERKVAEESLKKTEANLQTILNTNDTAYALLDRDLNVLEYNKKALTFARNEFNFDPENGAKIFDHLPESRRLQFFDYINKVFKGDTISYEVMYTQPDGINIWYYVRMFPIADKENEIHGLVLAITDITERKEAEESLQSAYERIKTQIKFIREMIWKQSHILRSPLANLKGLITILENDPTDKDIMNYIDIELNRLDTVIMEMAKDSAKDEMISFPS